jgi:fucose 4-O-acetylase-like acetyltransferase
MDALRALVVVGLIFFHSALVFDSEDDFYIKNDTTTSVLVAAGPIVIWAMPLLFLIAGFGAAQSLRRRGVGGFAVERLRRLGVPLVVATLVLLPLPPWLRLRAADPDGHPSYLAFYPHFFDVHLSLDELPFVVRGDQFESGHLWFVVLLLTFSLAVAVTVRLTPDRLRQSVTAAAGVVDRRPAGLLLAGIPTALVCGGLGLEEQYGGWHRLGYLLFFAYGLVLAADPRFRTAMRRVAPVAAGLAVTLFVLGAPAFVLGDEPFTALTPSAVAGRALFGAAGWCAVVAILGLLDRPRPSTAVNPPASRGRRARIGAYLGDAVLPLYVIHQPVVVAMAAVVVGWDLPMVVKYLLIVSFASVLTVACYDLLVRRTAPTRFLLGAR